MDIITKAIIDAVKGGGPDEAAPAYQTLKQLLRQKFSADGDLIDAVEKLEKRPTSAGRQALLEEEIKIAQAENDPQIRAAAQTLFDTLHPKPNYRPPHRRRPAPIQRPPAAGRFIGRTAELTAVIDDLAPGRVVGISGAAGAGKSVLAGAIVQQLVPKDKLPAQFADGLAYHSFTVQPRVDIALEEIARLFGGEPIPSPYEAVENILAGRKVLLILDDIERADDLSGILSIGKQCIVLAIGRHYPPELIDTDHLLEPMPPDEAVLLLQTWSAALNETHARRICELSGGLPLAVRLAGQHIAARKLKSREYVDWLESTRLKDLDPVQRQSEAVPLLIEHNLSQLSQSARETLRLIGLLAPVPFAAEVVAKTKNTQTQHSLFAAIRGLFRNVEAAAQSPQVPALLQELTTYGFLQHVEDRYQISHDLIYEYIRSHLTPSTKTIRQLATYFIGLAWEQDRLGGDGVARLEADRPHFMKLMDECIRWKEWNAAHGLAVAFEDYLDRQGHLADRVKANEIGLMAAWQLGRPNQGAWLGNLGDTYRTMGHAKWAIEHFNKALEAARQNGDRHSEGNSLGNLGLAYRDLGQLDQAIDYLKKAKRIFEDLHSPSASLVRDWLVELEEFEE